jgi:hypothetical protein
MHLLEDASMDVFFQQGNPACGRSSPSMALLNTKELRLACTPNALPTKG